MEHAIHEHDFFEAIQVLKKAGIKNLIYTNRRVF
jgi:hypothetical protein